MFVEGLAILSLVVLSVRTARVLRKGTEEHNQTSVLSTQVGSERIVYV